MASGGFLARLTDSARDRMLSASRPRTYRAGYFIFRPSDQIAGIVTSGLVRVFAIDDDGYPIIHRNVGPGGAIGLAAMVGLRNDLTAQAVTEVTVRELSSSALTRLRKSDPDVGETIAQEVYLRLVDTAAELSLRLRGGLEQRLALTLLDLAFQQPGDHFLSVSATHERLAEILGCSRESVSRHLVSLAGIRLVRQIGRGRLALLNPIRALALSRRLDDTLVRAVPADWGR